MTTTITIPDADEQLQIAINKRARASENLLLDADQKFACVLLRLTPATTEDDYASIGAAIQAIFGVQGASLLVDGQIPAVIPEDHQIRVYVEAAMRIEDIPGEP